MSQWGGKPALDKKAVKGSNCTSHIALARTKEKSESIAPGGQNKLTKTCKEIGRSTTIDVTAQRQQTSSHVGETGKKRVPVVQASTVLGPCTKTNRIKQPPTHSSLEASSLHNRPRMAVSAKECPSLGVILSVALLCLSDAC